jgi:hypothetical protein
MLSRPITSRNAYEILAQSQQKVNSSNPSPEDLSVPLPHVPLDPEDYPKLKYWYRHQWTGQKGSGKSESNAEPTRGGSKASSGVNVATTYVETAQGEPIDGYRARAVRKAAHALFEQYLGVGKAPKTWGAAQHEVKLHFTHHMVTQYPELGFCDDYWKPHYLATAIYSSWRKNASERSDGMKKEDDSNTKSCEKRSASHDDASASHDDASADSALPPLKKAKLGKGRRAKVSNIPICRSLFLLAIFHKAGRTVH